MLEIMTIKQYAESRNLPAKTVRKLILLGEIPASMLGNRYTLDADAADEYLKAKMDKRERISLRPEKQATTKRSRKQSADVWFEQVLAEGKRRILGDMLPA